MPNEGKKKPGKICYHGLMLRLIPITVQCYSGYKANERPLSFVWEDRKFAIEEVIDRWYGENYSHFKVKVGDGSVYFLKYDQKIDKWFLEQEDPNLKANSIKEDANETH